MRSPLRNCATHSLIKHHRAAPPFDEIADYKGPKSAVAISEYAAYASRAPTKPLASAAELATFVASAPAVVVGAFAGDGDASYSARIFADAATTAGGGGPPYGVVTTPEARAALLGADDDDGAADFLVLRKEYDEGRVVRRVTADAPLEIEEVGAWVVAQAAPLIMRFAPENKAMFAELLRGSITTLVFGFIIEEAPEGASTEEGAAAAAGAADAPVAALDAAGEASRAACNVGF